MYVAATGHVHFRVSSSGGPREVREFDLPAQAGEQALVGIWKDVKICDSTRLYGAS